MNARITLTQLAELDAVLENLWNGDYHRDGNGTKWRTDLNQILRAKCTVTGLLQQAGKLDLTIEK